MDVRMYRSIDGLVETNEVETNGFINPRNA